LTLARVRTKKSLGQNLLIDQQAVLKIVSAADLIPDDIVLEIGPGPGTLTPHLARRAGRVVAVEIDRQMLPSLEASLQGLENVTIVHGDILEQNIPTLVGHEYKVVANLPYYITSSVLRHVLSSSARPTLMVITIQLEVARRIVAQAGELSLLAVSVQFYGTPRVIARIPPGSFRPMPKVHSAIVRIDCFEQLPWGQVDEKAFFRTVRAGFAQRRKQLRNALKSGLAQPMEQILWALSAAGIDDKRRAQTLSIEEWIALSNALSQVEA
jgi:16S rRNA (adenine1518-N6/adenine1519-N6)-dimethyltransferase